LHRCAGGLWLQGHCARIATLLHWQNISLCALLISRTGIIVVVVIVIVVVVIVIIIIIIIIIIIMMFYTTAYTDVCRT